MRYEYREGGRDKWGINIDINIVCAKLRIDKKRLISKLS